MNATQAVTLVIFWALTFVARRLQRALPAKDPTRLDWIKLRILFLGQLASIVLTWFIIWRAS